MKIGMAPTARRSGVEVRFRAPLLRGDRAEQVDHPLRQEAPLLGWKPLESSREGSRLPVGSRLCATASSAQRLVE